MFMPFHVLKSRANGTVYCVSRILLGLRYFLFVIYFRKTCAANKKRTNEISKRIFLQEEKISISIEILKIWIKICAADK